MAGPLLSLKHLLCLFFNIHLDNFLYKPNKLLKLSSFSNIYHKNTPSYRPLRGHWRCLEMFFVVITGVAVGQGCG